MQIFKLLALASALYAGVAASPIIKDTDMMKRANVATASLMWCLFLGEFFSDAVVFRMTASVQFLSLMWLFLERISDAALVFSLGLPQSLMQHLISECFPDVVLVFSCGPRSLMQYLISEVSDALLVFSLLPQFLMRLFLEISDATLDFRLHGPHSLMWRLFSVSWTSSSDVAVVFSLTSVQVSLILCLFSGGFSDAVPVFRRQVILIDHGLHSLMQYFCSDYVSDVVLVFRNTSVQAEVVSEFHLPWASVSDAVLVFSLFLKRRAIFIYRTLHSLMWCLFSDCSNASAHSRFFNILLQVFSARNSIQLEFDLDVVQDSLPALS
ncbi:hypothetical protein C8R44DRAFT_736420 [Mycena epipterygia]|nr:hypothetical protein C8R44DRAFT_736420 [Mycena epipterygia]